MGNSARVAKSSPRNRLVKVARSHDSRFNVSAYFVLDSRECGEAIHEFGVIKYLRRFPRSRFKLILQPNYVFVTERLTSFRHLFVACL